jgi:hypothetical protein
VSTIQNWRLTRQVGRFVQGYARHRLELDRAIDALRRLGPEYVGLALEGIWYVFISDGRLTGVETALLAHLLRKEDNRELTLRFVSDEPGWLKRVSATAGAGEEIRRATMQVLDVAAANSDATSGPVRAVLNHATEALALPAPL